MNNIIKTKSKDGSNTSSVTWASEKDKYLSEKGQMKKHKSSILKEQGNYFAGFWKEDISCAHGINCGKLDVIHDIIKTKRKDGSATSSDSGDMKGSIPASRFLSSMSHILQKSDRKIKKRSDCKSERVIVKTGLVNLGNICYLNSIIQCLGNVTPLRDYFIRGDMEGEIAADGETAKRLGVVFRSLHSGQTRPINIEGFKMAIDNIHGQFNGYGQHDSHEFLVMLLDWLHRDLRTKTSWDLSDCIAGGNLLQQKSIIGSLFFGQHRVVISCSIFFFSFL